MVIGVTVLACFGPGAHVSAAQQPPSIEDVFPRQLVRGQTTVLSVAIPGRDAVQSAEISPSAGVTVSAVKKAEMAQGVAWWEVTVDVAKDAAPGNRALTLVMPTGRTAPMTLTIPAHVPGISDLKVLSTPSQPTVELQFSAADESSDLGTAPYVWFTMSCGGEPFVGAVKGKVTPRDARNGVVHATFPNPRTVPGAPPITGKCDLQVRASDSKGIDSNTLTTAVEFRN